MTRLSSMVQGRRQRVRRAIERPLSWRNAGPSRCAPTALVAHSTEPLGHARLGFRRISALERQRLEGSNNLMRAGIPGHQARLLASEIFLSPSAVAFRTCLPTSVVVQRAADRIRPSGIKARLAFAVAEFIHRPDHRITVNARPVKP